MEGTGYPGDPGDDMAGGMTGGGIDPTAAQSVSYPHAAPEDLQQVCSMWKAIIAQTEGMFRVVLAAAQPKYNAQDENDGRLFVVFADFLAERYIDNVQKKTELEQIIEEKTGKHVEVKFVLAADEQIRRGTLATIDLEERIHEFIHMDIEIEQEDPGN